jgi:hypothetical protein
MARGPAQEELDKGLSQSVASRTITVSPTVNKFDASFTQFVKQLDSTAQGGMLLGKE